LLDENSGPVTGTVSEFHVAKFTAARDNATTIDVIASPQVPGGAIALHRILEAQQYD
jgi:hypothetical protein